MFLDRVINFGETLRDRVPGRSQKSQKALIEVPNVVDKKIHVLSFNLILRLLRSFSLDRVINYGVTLGDQVKGRSPKKLESLIEVPNVVHMKVHVLSFNMILISSP